MSVKNQNTTSDYLNFDSALNTGVKIIKNDRNYKLGFLIVLGINTGVRIGDLLNLKHEDFLNGSISIVEKKTDKKRIVTLNENVRSSYDLLLKRDNKKEGYIFTSNQNTVLTSQYINRKLKEVFGSKNQNISTHSLRKTFGRRMWQKNGESDKALVLLSDIFNHSSTAITRVYLGIRSAEIANAYIDL
jgi:integrase